MLGKNSITELYPSPSLGIDLFKLVEVNKAIGTCRAAFISLLM